MLAEHLRLTRKRFGVELIDVRAATKECGWTTYGREEAELMMTEESDTLVAKRQWGFTWVFGGNFGTPLRFVSGDTRQRIGATWK